jgi:UDP-N-acetylglucosamine:LPS N-acetylglucosamine transferase
MKYTWLKGIDSVVGKRILFSPLNWGMGHVARSIGLIRDLQRNGNKVIVCCDEEQQKVYLRYFPQMECIPHAGYPFNFRGKGHFERDVFFRIFSLFGRYFREQREVDRYIKSYRIDVVIADHRYGFYSRGIPSIFVSHQLHLPLNWYLKPIQWLHAFLVCRFDVVWVPDTTSNQLAGKLSKSFGFKRVVYIGPISRFSQGYNGQRSEKVTVIISGPLCYAHSFVRKIVKEFASKHSLEFIGDSQLTRFMQEEGLMFVPSTDWIACDRLICSAQQIISRSGYSTLMDLYFLKTPAILFATEGQREQEYLLELWEARSVQRTTT